MYQFIISSRRACTALVLGASLSACGGGGGGQGATPTPVPVVATPVPSAQADLGTTGRNQNVTLSVLANDSVTNGGQLTLVAVSAPAHGSAVISGAAIVYTPAPGFFGKDSFSYTVKDIGTGTAAASADVAVTVVAGELVVSGQMMHAPLNANVSIAVGARTYATVTDATGKFSVPISLDDPASMVTVTAQGIGAAANIKLASHLGSSQALSEAAGAAAAVSQAQLPGLNLSSVTTAVYALVTKKNGGVAPASQPALDAAASGVAVGEVVQMSALVRALAGYDNPYDEIVFPAGAADTLALVQNTDLYRQFVKQTLVDGGALESAKYQVLYELKSLAAPVVTVEKAKSLTFFRNEWAVANPASLELVLDPDGSGSAYKENQRVAGTWKNDGGLTLTLTTPLVRKEVRYQTKFPYDPYEIQYVTKALTMRRLTGSNTQGFAAITQTGTLHYPGGEQRDSSYSNTEVQAFRDWASLSAPSDLGGSTLAGLLDPVPGLKYDAPQLVLALAANGSATSPQLPGSTAAWKLQDGKLVIDFASGARQTLARVGVDANGDEHWLARSGTGADYAVHELMVARVQPGLAWTSQSVVNRWGNAIARTEITPNFVVTVRADNTSADDTVSVGGGVAPSRQTSWQLLNGELVMRSYMAPGGRFPVASCPAGVTCTVHSERRWTLLRVDAAGIVVLEQGVISPTDTRQRVNRYAPL